MIEDKKANKYRWQSVAGFIALVIGGVISTVAVFIPPKGEIHPSVLVFFGQCLMYSGALLGVKYYADFKTHITELMNEGNKRKK